jgi:hypothetical protein
MAMCTMLIWHLQLESAARPVCLPDGNSMSYLKHMVGKDVHTLILTCPELEQNDPALPSLVSGNFYLCNHLPSLWLFQALWLTSANV